MNEIIGVAVRKFNGEGVQTVNARELHAFLESKQEYATWIKGRIDKYGFVEDEDYLIILSNNGERGKPRIEYFITLDMAKELSMVERNAKGKQARKYFIACEKKLLSDGHKHVGEWFAARKDGKAIYMQKTDVIQDFVMYATEQGSKSAQHYYSNIANMQNRALFILECKYPNVREVLNIKQLMHIATADHIVEKALKEGMEQGMFYKDIYALAKDKIATFATVVGSTKVSQSTEVAHLTA